MSFLHTLAASLPMHPETRTDFAGLLPLPRSICNRRFLYVYLLATVHKNFWTDLHEIFREGCQWANEQMINFWWQSGLWIQIRTTTLVRRALAEVCTLPVLLVYFRWEKRANWIQRQGNHRHHTSPTVLPPGESIWVCPITMRHITHYGQRWCHPQNRKYIGCVAWTDSWQHIQKIW